MKTQEVCDMTNDALRWAGLSDKAEIVEEPYIGIPELPQYVEIEDGIAIFPDQLPDGRVGWGVSASVVIPGTRDYPDDHDVVEIAAPFEVVRSFRIRETIPRCALSAVRIAVEALVSDRMRHWHYEGAT
jgi:hypothetical protein